MNAHTRTYPLWIEDEDFLDSFTVQTSATGSFHVKRDGCVFYLVLPGIGVKRCWNRTEVERACYQFIEDAEARFAESEDEEEEYPEFDRECSRGDFRHQAMKEGSL